VLKSIIGDSHPRAHKTLLQSSHHDAFAMKLHSSVAFFCLFPSFRSCVVGFIPSPEKVTVCLQHHQEESLRATTARRCYSQERIEAAKPPLLWEVIEKREAQPVLNLSNRDEVFADLQTEAKQDDSWQDGQQWATTRARLQEMGIRNEDADKLLEAVPQLLRIDTDIIVDSCSAVMDLLDGECLLREPRLLSFRGDDVRYGVEFLSTMMASTPSTVLQACCVSPSLLLAAVEGGLQEQAVKRALGAAGQAADTANKRIAGDVAASLQALRQRKPPGL
jgi:hypothetical protein